MGKFTNGLILLLLFQFLFASAYAYIDELKPDSARKIHFYVGYQGFFDNREFNNVQNQLPTTFFGHRIELAANFHIDSTLSFTFGINPLQEFGSPVLFSFVQSTIYVQKQGRNYQFLFGSFPRTYTIDYLPRALFSDTITYYRPNITGLSFRRKKGNHFFSSWIDWTAQKTTVQREHFHIGIFSKMNMKQFSIQFYSLLSHLANDADNIPRKPLEESLMNQVTFQYHIKLNQSWNYQTAISLLHSLERVRNGSPTRSASSILIENTLSTKFLELKHTLKRGESHFIYSGDPFYQYANYARLDLLLNTLKSQKINIQGGYSLRFINEKLLHQQKITVTMQI